MITMLYDAEILKPQLLVEEEIQNGDIGKKFYVINGCWYGTFNGDSIVIHSPYDDYIPATVYACYTFKTSPPEEYFDMFESFYPRSYSGIPYEPWFAHFKDLVERGEVV